MSEDLDPLDWLEEVEERHEELEEDDDDKGAYEDYLESFGERYEELDSLEAAILAFQGVPDFKKQVDKADKLDQVDPTVAEIITKSGQEDGETEDDVVSVKKKSWPATSLKPSQTTMQLPKAIGMALFMLKSGKVGGDLGALVSKDSHILDGHHRWAATILASGKKGKVGGWAADLPGNKLLRVLNIISKGMFNVRNGKPGAGRLSDFTPRDVRGLLEEFVEDGIPGKFPWSPEDVQKVLEDNFGSVEDGIDAMSKHVKLLSKDVPNWAPDRKQMPVIEPEQVPDAADALNEGDVDWNEPHVSGALQERLEELDQLEAVASDTAFMEACAEFGLEDFIRAKVRLADEKPNQIDDAQEDPRLRKYLNERARLYKEAGAPEGSSYVQEVDEQAVDLEDTEDALAKACITAASQMRAAKIDYPKALLVAREIEGELDRLANGRVRSATTYIALKGVRLKMRKLKSMLD